MDTVMGQHGLSRIENSVSDDIQTETKVKEKAVKVEKTKKVEKADDQSIVLHGKDLAYDEPTFEVTEVSPKKDY